MTLIASGTKRQQQLSRSSQQQLQYQSLTSPTLQHSPIMVQLRFGTRRSEVQILSPRPNLSMAYMRFLVFVYRDVDEIEAGESSKVNKH
ncbi:MAG: hypothetical protein DMG65_09895 [Candidatus Angelobacter sp. Gp1-AA117]|nr:MAG: hypothetical protein DMG65_09895 [Candidatus Angelobacter sp. Gp1-AA117]